MEVEILAFGNPEKVKTVANEFPHSQRGDVFLISVPRNLQKYTISCLASENVKAVTLQQFQKALTVAKRSAHLLPVDSSAAFAWLSTGTDYFYVLYNGCLEMNSIDKKRVAVVAKVEPVSKCAISHNGAIYGLIKGAFASFCIGDRLDLVFDIRLEDPIDSIIFSQDDSLAALVTAQAVQVCHIFKGALLYEFPAQPFSFTSNNSIYFPQSRKTVHLGVDSANDEIPMENLSLRDAKGRSVTAYDRGRVAQFIDGEYQKIVYEAGGKTTTKSVTHVKKIVFHFAKNRLFAFLTKNPGSGDFYVLESYLDGEVTSLNLEHNIIDISVTDEFVAVQLANFEVQFYIKEKYNFRLLQSISKGGKTRLACFDTICCMFTSDTGSVEFYDRGVLRSSYSHPGCAEVAWSKEGLYVAAFSYSEAAGCLVQIFNSNGVLVFKKVYNSLNTFGWRPAPEVDEKEKERILSEHPLSEIPDRDDQGDKDTEILIQEWREYLTQCMRDDDAPEE